MNDVTRFLEREWWRERMARKSAKRTVSESTPTPAIWTPK